MTCSFSLGTDLVAQKGFTEGDTWRHEACPDSPSRKCSLCLLQIIHFMQVLGAQALARPCLNQPPLPPSSPLLPPPSLRTQLSQLTLIPPEGFGQLRTCSPSGWINGEVQSLRLLRTPVCLRAPAFLEHRQSTTSSSLPEMRCGCELKALAVRIHINQRGIQAASAWE